MSIANYRQNNDLQIPGNPTSQRQRPNLGRPVASPDTVKLPRVSGSLEISKENRFPEGRITRPRFRGGARAEKTDCR